MKKLLLLATMLLASNIVVLAEDYHLYMYSNNGETQDWSIPTLQKMTFENGNVVLTTKIGTSVYTPISSIAKLYINTPSAHGIETTNKNIMFYWEGELLKVDVQPGSQVSVYNAAGVVVKHERLDGNVIDLQGCAKGLYVVNVDGQIFKTIKK